MLEKKIGRGTYGVVFKAKSSLFGETVAIKITDAQESLEVAHLQRAQNPYVVKLLDAYFDPSSTVLVLEHMDMTLHSFLNSSSRRVVNTLNNIRFKCLEASL